MLARLRLVAGPTGLHARGIEVLPAVQPLPETLGPANTGLTESVSRRARNPVGLGLGTQPGPSDLAAHDQVGWMRLHGVSPPVPTSPLTPKVGRRPGSRQGGGVPRHHQLDSEVTSGLSRRR